MYLFMIMKNKSELLQATICADRFFRKPNSVLGLATGSTPLKPYGQMIELFKKGAIDFSKVTTFNLDEYVNLDVEDVNSYHSFMHKNLFDHINIPGREYKFS